SDLEVGGHSSRPVAAAAAHGSSAGRDRSVGERNRIGKTEDNLIVIGRSAAAAFDACIARKWQVNVEGAGGSVGFSRDDLRRRGGQRDKNIPHRFRDALRAVLVAA